MSTLCKSPQKTRSVAIALGISVDVLLSWIYRGRIDAPGKDISDEYVWTDQDVQAARKVLAGRRKPAEASRA